MVAGEMLITDAVSSMESPPKNRSSANPSAGLYSDEDFTSEMQLPTQSPD
jgi:hypothetical protein